MIKCCNLPFVLPTFTQPVSSTSTSLSDFLFRAGVTFNRPQRVSLCTNLLLGVVHCDTGEFMDTLSQLFGAGFINHLFFLSESMILLYDLAHFCLNQMQISFRFLQHLRHLR